MRDSSRVLKGRVARSTALAERMVRGTLYRVGVMTRFEMMNVGLGRTSLVVAAGDGPDG